MSGSVSRRSVVDIRRIAIKRIRWPTKALLCPSPPHSSIVVSRRQSILAFWSLTVDQSAGIFFQMSCGIPAGIIVVHLVTSLLLATVGGQLLPRNVASNSAFFFFCQPSSRYGLNRPDSIRTIHVKLSGKPEFYQSGQIYRGCFKYVYSFPQIQS